MAGESRLERGRQRGRLGRTLFPAEPRQLPGRRGLKIGMRAVHVLCAGILVGAYMFQAEPEARTHWLLATMGSGLLIFLLDLHETGVFLVQVRGLIVLSKITLLALLPLLEQQAVWILCTLVLVSVLSSHAPSKIRYFLFFGRGRLKGSESKG